ncbi:CPBP family intramembrane glutamic endopeptidase [Priestia megaterium]|uniref:CPBP family intramembrane glutamic endopeptidase n=1 Tax=Priestia megaterium TaxID=1404 RepID=UPI0007627702|nr:CPBP family intramembrane glutamic endopeptidase [Priestia megaterium]KWU58478.1 peptidase [Priestia megaterium]
MEKRYWYVILTYILMQFSGVVGIPLLKLTGVFDQYPVRTANVMLLTYWTIISFILGLLIVLLLLRRDMSMRIEHAGSTVTVVWSVLGVFLAMAGQAVAGMIEHALGITQVSENTQNIVNLVKATPFLIVVTSVIGPILEEIIFRKIIFGSLHKRYNFFISAFISSLIFAAVHWDFKHLLVYTAMGFVFAFLYARTRLIIVPIIAHVLMNTIVILSQTIFADKIIEMQKQAEQMQFIFGGMFL